MTGRHVADIPATDIAPRPTMPRHSIEPPLRPFEPTAAARRANEHRGLVLPDLSRGRPRYHRKAS